MLVIRIFSLFSIETDLSEFKSVVKSMEMIMINNRVIYQMEMLYFGKI